MLVHGLTGSAESAYMRGTAIKALRRGFLVGRLNIRNCGGTEELSGTIYHGGLTADVAAGARELSGFPGIERLHLAGFSLGGNMVLNYAAREELPHPNLLESVAGVSPCIDLAASAAALDRGPYERLLQRHFLSGLKRVYRRRHALHPDHFPIDGLDEVDSIRALDERFTAPLAGYRDADDYYARASVLRSLGELRVPALLLSARDDPVVPFAAFEHEEVRRNRRIRIHTTDQGGHVAFIGRRPGVRASWVDDDRYWAENRVVQFAIGCDLAARER